MIKFGLPVECPNFKNNLRGNLLLIGYALISMVDFVENVWTSICKPESKSEQITIGTPIRIRSRLSSRRSSAESHGSGYNEIENSQFQ